MNNKRNKKKLLILILLLFAVISITGYGAYSYFWTSGSFSGNDSVEILSFNPEMGGSFLANGGTLTLSCPNSDLGNETVTCEGTVEVTNSGGSDVVVEASNANVTISHYNSSSDDVTATAGEVTFSWTDTTIAAGESETLTVSVPVDLSSNFGSDSSSYRSSEYDGEDIEVNVTFKITASQVH